MVEMKTDVTPRGRLDHRLPQSYLEGFLNGNATQLWVYDRGRTRWFEAIPRAVAAGRGYFDYSPGSVPDQTADQAFEDLETKFPVVRAELLARNFSDWQAHLDFLLTYAQMLRTRTELFREQTLANARTQTMLSIAEVLPPDPETGHMRLQLRELTETPDEREMLHRNQTITTMRNEIAQGTARFANLNWCLRLAIDPSDPVITSDYPVIAQGRAPTPDTMFDDTDTLVFVPLCREACLIGSPGRFLVPTEPFQPADIRVIRSLFFGSDCRFVYSPIRLTA